MAPPLGTDLPVLLDILTAGFEAALSELAQSFTAKPRPGTGPDGQPTNAQLQARAAAGCPMAQMQLAATAKPPAEQAHPHHAGSPPPPSLPPPSVFKLLVSDLRLQKKETAAEKLESAYRLLSQSRQDTAQPTQNNHPHSTPDGTVPKVGAIVNPAADPMANPRPGPDHDSGLHTRRQSASITGSLPRSYDPIMLELLSNQGSQSVTGPQQARVCPIRFLNFHSPDDLADYFGKHKHEIPRSHQVCVDRFQKGWNDQLDATYGSDIPQMIKRLGEKHQPMLPPKDDATVADLTADLSTDPIAERGAEAIVNNATTRSNSSKRPPIPANHTIPANDLVEKWKATVDEPTPPNGYPDQDREQRFDRPMREVRVGESPSRPWGIPVPPGIEQNPRTAVRCCAEINGGQKPAGCPMDRFQKWQAESETRNGHVPSTLRESRAGRSGQSKKGDGPTPVVATADVLAKPGTVFTGPVFIGYSVEQAQELLSRLWPHPDHITKGGEEE